MIYCTSIQGRGAGKGCTSWQLILTVQILQLQAPYIFIHRRVNLLWWYTCSPSNSCCIFTLSVFLVPWLIRCARINYIYSNLSFWATTRSLLTKELPFSLLHPALAYSLRAFCLLHTYISSPISASSLSLLNNNSSCNEPAEQLA